MQIVQCSRKRKLKTEQWHVAIQKLLKPDCTNPAETESE
jgi:hypothetical protein